MKDFRCCGLTLASTHELLQHYEENHAQQMPASRKTSAQPGTDSRKPSTGEAPATAQGNGGRPEQTGAQLSSDHLSVTGQRSSATIVPRNEQQPADDSSMELASTQFPAGQDMDGLQDMEMDMDDDAMAPSHDLQQQQYPSQGQPRMTQRFQFGQPSPRVPPLELNTMNMGNHLQQHQGLRNSTPTTPVTSGRNAQYYQNNPTVSSVNTPTLSTHPRQQQQQQQHAPTPDSSVPGTPGELDNDFAGRYGNLNIGNQQLMQNQYQNLGGYYDYGNGHDMLDLCIDEPAKRLFQYNGGQKSVKQNPSASQLGDGQYSENSELARTIREQQRIAGVPDPQTEGGVPKPFHCPVIGCEKAYKNQNGLKYHKAVSLLLRTSVLLYLS